MFIHLIETLILAHDEGRVNSLVVPHLIRSKIPHVSNSISFPSVVTSIESEVGFKKI